MASTITIDFDSLLTPIPGDNPSGESLRYAGPYDAIREAGRADDANLNQGDWKRDLKVANWREVIELATGALTAKSKDLQIAAWLTEGLIKQYGFAGSRDGLRLLRELQERFWDSVHPLPEDGDLELRGSALEWVNDRLPAGLKALAVTKGGPGETFSFVNWQESRQVEEAGRKSPEALQAAIAEGKITGEQWDKAVALGDRAFYEALYSTISESVAECGKLAAVVDEKFGNDGPSLTGLRKALEDCLELVNGIVRKKRDLEPDPVPADSIEATAIVAVATNGAGGVTSSAPRVGYAGGNLPLEPVDRADALQRLEAVAGYFLRTEPHSPVAYLVQRAVRWGQMPLEQWLKDVVGDEGVLAHIRETLGIKESQES
jgi:type VI secretion system protein ImpA